MTLAYNLSLAVEKAAKKAAKKAREEGIAIGEERGISIGRNEGISLGAQQAKLETAKILKSAGVEINLIINSTGLSPEEIEKL